MNKSVIVGAVAAVLLVGLLSIGTLRKSDGFRLAPNYVRGGSSISSGLFGTQGTSGWLEISVKRFGDGRIHLPITERLSRSVVGDLSGELDGPYVHYYGHGPFKSVIAAQFEFDDGEPVHGTFWDERGQLVRQERWEDGAIVETKASGPWWDGEEDQEPEDGWYTSLLRSSLVLGGGLYQDQYRIASQWRFEDGEIVEYRNSSPWAMPDEGFWRLFHRILRIDGENGFAFYLRGRKVEDRDEVLVGGDTEIQVRIKGSEIWYEHKGQQITFDGGLDWP